MDFACEDFSYQSAEQAKVFTALMQSSLPPLPGVEWIERTQIQPLLSELEHSVSGMVSRDTAVRVGRWAGADLALRGGFSINQGGRRTLQLQLIDLVHAQVFAATNVALDFGSNPRLKATPEPVAKTAAVLAEWLPAQQRQWRSQQDKIFVTVISPGPFPRLLEEVKQKAATGEIVLVVPQQARVAIEEADLGLLGLSEVSGSAWRRFADSYVWQGSPVTRTTNQTPPTASVLQVWDGRTAPVVLAGNGAASALSTLLASRKAEVLAHRADAATGEVWRRAVSDSIAGPLGTQEELSPSWFDELSRTEARWNAFVYRLETAAFVDPSNARVREAWLRVRWHPNLQGRAVSRQRFRRLRSDAWTRHVERFGTNSLFCAEMEPVGVHAILSTLDAMESYSDSIQDGVPPDMPASVEVGWRKELKQRLAKLTLLFAEEPALARMRTRLLFVLAYDDVPTDPAPCAQALERLLKNLVRDPAAFGFTRWDPPARDGVARIFAAAGRTADGALWLRKVDEAVTRVREAAKEQKPASLSSLRMPLPRVSALYSLACQPAFDSGEVELPLPQVSATSVRVPFREGPPVSSICQLVAGRNAIWLIGETTTSAQRPIGMSSSDVGLRGQEFKERRLWRIDRQTCEAKEWTNGLGNGEPWSVMEVGNEVWVGLEQGGVVSVNLTDGRTTTQRAPDAVGLARRGGLRGQSSEQAIWPVAAMASLNGGSWLSAAALLRFDASSNAWVEVLPRGTRQSIVSASAQTRWLAVSPPWLLARHAQLLVADSRDNRVGEFRPTWPGAADLLNLQKFKLPPVGDGHGGFWAGIDEALVWFDGAGSNVWRTKFEYPTTVTRGRFWLDQEHTFGANLAVEFRPEELEEIRTQWARRGRGVLLASRLPGVVTALAADGDWLWMATVKGGAWLGAGSRLSLLHTPSRRWVASMPLESRVVALAATVDAVWMGVDARGAAAAAPVVKVDKRPWLAVPEDKWLSSEPTRNEVALAEKQLTPRQRALRAMFRGEPQLLLNEYAGQDPMLLDPETLFLLARAHDTNSLNQPGQVAKFETILLREYPESPFGRWVQEEHQRARLSGALARRTPPTSSDLDRRVEELFERYDDNHDGELSAAEVELLMQLESDQFGPQVFTGRSVPPRQEMFLMRFRRHAGVGVNKEELRAALRGAPSAFQSRRPTTFSR